MNKIWRCPYSNFGDYVSDKPDADLWDETISAVAVYTDEILKGIAEAGFNAIWLHGQLHHLVRVEPFLELGKNAERHLSAMRELIERAAKHGIRVFIYMTPPRALPVTLKDFWNRHPDIWGQENQGVIREPMDKSESIKVVLRSLCTSTQKVKSWLENAMHELVSQLPDLAGVIVITASEFYSHCYSHRRTENPTRWAPLIECPRCREREREEFPGEILSALQRGAGKTSKNFEIIAWNWSWSWRPDSQAKVIENLPEGIILMADFERGGVKDIPGRKGHLYDEYSLGYAGPSQRFLEALQLAENRGLRMMTKLQIGTTHELPSVVSLPLLGNIFDKANFLKTHALSGFMGCWNFGNMLSANVTAFNRFLSKESSNDRNVALETFAADYFPGVKSKQIRMAWETFGRAMEYYPFSIAFLYHGACGHTLAYREMYVPAPLTGKPTGPSWKIVDRGDNLENSYMLDHTEFTLDDVVERLGKVAAVWEVGVRLMREALADASGVNVENEMGNAIICGAVWRSAENTYKVYRMRSQWDESQRERFERIVEDELDILRSVLPFVRRDSRQGFHAEPQFAMFNTEKIEAKIKALECLIPPSEKTC